MSEESIETRFSLAPADAGLRFMQMVISLDNIQDTYTIPPNAYKSKRLSFPHHTATMWDTWSKLRVHLFAWVRYRRSADGIKSSRSEARCLSLYAGQKVPTVARRLPLSIVQALSEQCWHHAEVNVTWIVCYLTDNKPDTTKTGWEQFQCAHLCLNGDWRAPAWQAAVRCARASHLCWESCSDWHRRIQTHDVCMLPCTCSEGCTKTICQCQGLHEPCCL
jgi:hypothetical protein